ncbi:MAG TPA: hypothetical protein VMN76_05550 [Acidobacteriota bacterium]|nr:hypothetical protein [Acidobacteriota bacterium]
MTTRVFGFGEIEKAFRMMEGKEDRMIEPPIEFQQPALRASR